MRRLIFFLSNHTQRLGRTDTDAGRLHAEMCIRDRFQSIGKSGRATFLSSIRSGVIFIPALLILSRVLGLFGIQISQALSDLISAAITMPMVLAFFNTLPEDEPDQQ